MERHLAPPKVKVENTDTGPKGDKMTVSLMDMIAQHWLMRTDPRLVNIVKVEYATELKKGTRICELVPQISNCVDDLLARHETSSVVTNRIQQDTQSHGVTQEVQIARVQNSSKLPLPKFRMNPSKQSKGGNRGRGSFNNRNKSRPTCPTCSQLRSSYNLPGLDIYHEARDCHTVKNSTVRKVDTNDEDEVDGVNVHEEDDDVLVDAASWPELKQSVINPTKRTEMTRQMREIFTAPESAQNNHFER